MKWRRTRALLEREFGTLVLAAAILGTIAARPFRRLRRGQAPEKVERPASEPDPEHQEEATPPRR